MPFTRKYVRSEEEYDLLRGERRSFFCPNKLWEEMLKQNYGIMSVSEFIKQAIIEKMIRNEPKQEEFFKNLI